MTNLSSLTPVLIGLLVAVVFIVRQFSLRRVSSAWTVLVPLGLAFYGATNLGTPDTTGLVLLAVNTSLGLGLGLWRGTTFRLSMDANGNALMQGTRTTLVLWVVTIGVRVVLSFVERQTGLSSNPSVSSADLLIPVAATLAAQNVVVYLRSRDRQLVPA